MIVLWELLCDHLTARNDYNLVRMDAQGHIVWVAELPRNDSDSFVDVRLDNGRLMGNTWSCYLVTLDIATGHILTAVFTK